MVSESLLPTEVNTELSNLYLGSQKSRFTRNLDLVQTAGRKDGENAMVIKPLQEIKIYDPTFSLPVGKNNAIGRCESPTTNELYVFVHNSNLNHCIYRVREGRCQMVFVGRELKFRLRAENFIGTGRAAVIPVCIGGKNKTYLLWTDGYNTQRFLCVEDSISTNYYSRSFNRFNGKFDREELISLGLAAPWDCIGITEVATAPADKNFNKISKNTWQFRISYYDVYGRPSEHGVYSNLYYQGDCSGRAARCLDVTFDAGGPLVDQIRIEVRKACSTEWTVHDTVWKYERTDVDWWLKKTNTKINLDPTTNKITYRFCADKQCIPVAGDERSYNPLPILSESLFFIGGGIGLAGNLVGRKPFGKEIMDKISVSLEKPSSLKTATPTRNIVVWVQILNAYNNLTQAIYKNPDGDRIVFGGVGPDGREEDSVQGSYGQYFGDPQQEGFIGFLAGTGQHAISRQYRYEPAFSDFLPPADETKWIYHGVAETRNEVRKYMWLQRFEFKNVRPGKYRFRIAGHHSRVSDANYQRTSTYVPGLAEVRVDGRLGRDVLHDIREVEINVCDGDYNTLKGQTDMLMIWDMTEPHKEVNLRREIKVQQGYVAETLDADNNIIPIEFAKVETNADDGVRMAHTTDHNGFYFVGAKDKNFFTNIIVRRKCEYVSLDLNRMERTSTFDLFEGWGSIFTSDNLGVHHKNMIATKKWPDYLNEKCNRTLVRGKVVDCNTGAGIKGVMVIMGRGHAVSTNENGEYEMVAHDWVVGHRVESIFFLGSATCALLTCDDKICLPQRRYEQVGCGDCNERIYTVSDVQVKFVGGAGRGLQLGGRYLVGIKGADWMDRKGFVQTDDRFFLDIPTANELGGYGYPRLAWRFDSDIRFPLWVKKLYFNITKNLRFSDFLSWVVDRFDFIDNTGNKNSVSPTQIKVYYSSLNEYNKQYNFATNSTWQLIDEKDSLKQVDTVHFVSNGDGKLFTSVITEKVRMDKDGSYFLIDYNKDLAGLQEGALIKFFREQDCSETELFFEVCGAIDVVDGVPQATGGYLDVYDSYFVYREVPTPVVRTVKKTKTIVNGSTVTYEEVAEDQTTNVLRFYGWPFEHHSPSDFWGTKCANRGRVGTKNDLEDEICREDEIALSGAVGDNSLSNYLHYFDEKRMKRFRDQKRGSIVACIVEGNVVLAICEADHFTAPFDDDLLRVANDNTVRAASGEQTFGKPRRKSGQNYGCRKRDRNTIAYFDGVVQWVDTNKVAQVYHNFDAAIDVSTDRYKTFLRRKLKDLQRFERTSSVVRYLHGNFSPKDKQVYTTDFNVGENRHIVKNEFSENIESNETWAVDVGSQALRKYCSFTPELYGYLTGEDTDEQFFSFREGLPYAHHTQSGGNANNFYGVQCQHAMRLVMATDPLQVKEYVGIEVYADNVLMYSPKNGVTTEWNQKSQLPRNRFVRNEKYWLAPFLCDAASVQDASRPKETGANVLFDGDKLRGRWIEFLLVGDPDNLGKYFELTAVVVFVNGIEKTGA